jgi:hypothetical protein
MIPRAGKVVQMSNLGMQREQSPGVHALKNIGGNI